MISQYITDHHSRGSAKEPDDVMKQLTVTNLL